MVFFSLEEVNTE